VDNGGEFTSLLDTAGGAPGGRRASLGAGKKSASRKRNGSSGGVGGSGSKKSRLKSAAVPSPTAASRQLRSRNTKATTTSSKSAAAHESLQQPPRSILPAAAAASCGTTTAAGEDKRSTRQSLPRHQIDWSRAIHLQQPARHYALVLDQLFSNDSCLNNSSCSEQLDGANSCPGCGDSFLLPTTFFQHLYRRSVRIRFECRGCDGVKYLEFTNKCLFRLHLLSHLEQGEEGLETGLLELSSLQPDEMLDINSNSNNSSSNSILSSLHRRTQSQLARSETEVQCMECLQVGLCLLNKKSAFLFQLK
jgi:hypothetical protein